MSKNTYPTTFKSFQVFIALCCLCLPSLVLSQESTNAGLSDTRLSRYGAFIKKEISSGQIPGGVSLVVRNDEVAHSQAFGFEDIQRKTRMTKDQIFYIQSMTKPIITVAFMMLYEEGHFFLSDPVSKYLPYFENIKVAIDVNNGASGPTDPINEPITIAHLLSHTAGFSHGLGASQLDKEVLRALYFEPQKNIASRVKTLASMPLVGQPGEQWYYSAAPDVLSLLIEKFSGTTTADFLRKRIFEPLQMNDSGYNLTKSQSKRVVKLHSIDDQGLLGKSERQPNATGNTVFGGTHGLFSTASDYMKFCKMLLNNGEWKGRRYLSRKTIELMTADHVGELYGTPGQGFGLGFGVTTNLAKSQAVGSVGQYYWSGAYCTYFFIDPKEKLIAIFMTQMASYTGYYGQKMRQYVYQAIDD